MKFLQAFVSMLLFSYLEKSEGVVPKKDEKEILKKHNHLKHDFVMDDVTVIIEDSDCIQFTIGEGTGCQWMCNYCASQLGTNNYYFTDSVCMWQDTGCTGNPVSGNTYKCCKSAEKKEQMFPLNLLLQ